MSLKDYEPRIAKSALHRKEEHVKQVFRDQVAEAAGLLEVVLSAIVLVALLLLGILITVHEFGHYILRA